ncbi:MAG: SRPBCC family protein [Thermoanaerobaculia bacterium]
MPVLECETFVPAPRSKVFAFFGDPGNLARITPSTLGFETVEAPDRTLRSGDRIRYRIRLLGIPVPWTSRITEWVEGIRFVDEQERGPYRRWRHEHVLRDSDGGTLMTDHVEYELPFGILGRTFGGWWVRRNLRHIFDHRARVIREIFPPPQR